MNRGTAVIVGAGPAGLTAAVELLRRSRIQPIVLEQSAQLGGLAQTIVHHGNHMDIGGHRFFSKSDRVVNWWLDLLPLEQAPASGSGAIPQPGHEAAIGPDPDHTDRVMLVRSRKSRIYWGRQLFDYPLSLSADTIRKMGLWRLTKAGCSYVRSAALPIRPEISLADFFINRFGRELYHTFFKTYTEKVWGMPCDQIPASWGAQRIKGLSIAKALRHALSAGKRRSGDVAQKDTETSLIERFMYPKFGPGQMWETAAAEVQARGGRILMGHELSGVRLEGNRIVEAEAKEVETGKTTLIPCDVVFSSMAIKDLVHTIGEAAPPPAREVARGLPYRDFMTVGLLVTELRLRDDRDAGRVRDNWIYIQEPDVLVGRLQIFNNWSPYLVADPSKVWLGLEYFCNEGEDPWSRSDENMIDLGSRELEKIGLIDRSSVIDGCVVRMRKAYPAYFGTYARLAELRPYLDSIGNLYCVGRNGQHRYNNQDHSMLTAMIAVDNILEDRSDKSNVWDVNTEEDYHEARK